MPAEGAEVLEDLAFDLAREASELSGQLHPVVRLSVADLVRSMNCYYSNLIEGHNTHPRDIDRALTADYSRDPARRDLQLEARAHIEVQRLIDSRQGFPAPPATFAFVAWAHREFCTRLPESLLAAVNPDTGERMPVVPGEARTRDVAGGQARPADSSRFAAVHDSVRAGLRLVTSDQDAAGRRRGRGPSPVSLDPPLSRRQWPRCQVDVPCHVAGPGCRLCVVVGLARTGAQLGRIQTTSHGGG